jgi:hypothetical protein
MKPTVLFALLAAAPALLAAEPSPSTAAVPATQALALPEDLAEEAALVQQIGEEAARGFDAEAHARALRAQIEALVSTPSGSAPVKTVATPAPTLSVPASKPLEKPTVTTTTTPALVTPPASSKDSALREAVQRVKTALNELELQVNREKSR